MVCVPILLPIYATGNYGQSGMEALSMANIPPGDSKHWGPVICVWLISLIAYRMLHVEYKTNLRLRHAFLKLRLPHSFSVLVQDIPKGYRSDEQGNKRAITPAAA